ncbi:PAS domain-containing protein [Parvibaculum sp.]|jgi:hypothetical protein|uniref:PAS domain-containing protein n=1 Tax=Parvibaculum sp. TaxID=2024848 RepID=UPI000C4E7F6B|nr:PAS domain-containing protein [Parvibaculum sp.]MAM94234.1 hypothetical protein [Parvibaculum sp.]HCX67309.1 hypothetical protein [Rhodobiaceae bacterium]|tara:strand:- start:41489 stop:42067 length:579 start_codon:yes stop_codon:yes gene_type:complete
MVALIRPLRNENEASPARRSERSIAFVKAWATIPRKGFIPDKADFRPERLAAFLNDVYLVELHEDLENRIRFRIAGEHIRNGLGFELKGRNYIDFVPDDHRAMSGMSMHRMFAPQPCGRWVRKCITRPGREQNIVELTQLPMMDRTHGVKLVIGIAEGFAEALLQSDCGSQGVLFENLESEHFFDIGAGLPA